MELKVWVEGIQRIVCGVNEKTTCQDVVYALAHATGKTGRFTLIERWRNSERLLAPNEQPLKVLLKWGEHSNDVQFILQWAPLDSSVPKAPTKNLETQNSDYSYGKNNPPLLASPPGSAQPNGTSSKRKSLPFSSNFGNLPSPDGGSMKRNDNLPPSVGVVRGIPQRMNEAVTNSSSSSAFEDPSTNGKVINTNNSGVNNKILSGGPESTFDGDGSSPGKKPKELNLSGPPPYREPPNPAKILTHSPVNVNSGSKGLPPYREPPPPNLNHQQVPPQQRASVSSSPVVQNNPPQSLPLLGSGIQSSNSSVNHMSGSGGHHGKNPAAFDTSSSATSSYPRFTEPYNVINFSKDKTENLDKWINKDHSVTNGDISASNQNGSLPKQAQAPPTNPQFQELVRLINLQREKLTSQHAEMTQYDAEIMFWEGKAREQQRHLEFITKEISRLELVSAQQESQVLSLLHLEEENDIVKQQSDNLKKDMDDLRTEFDKCEKELNTCKSKMGLLKNELMVQQSSMKQRQEEWMQREASTLAEIDRLKKELELARRETDAVTDLSGTLDMEVSTIEADLAGKKKQMERLINAMKEANLQSLSIQPPEELIDGGAHQRSGSTRPRRMIGSPRQLENAAPTRIPLLLHPSPLRHLLVLTLTFFIRRSDSLNVFIKKQLEPLAVNTLPTMCVLIKSILPSAASNVSP
ncbi:unnamed protein product [Allacma fusca]|uniref:Ras-associating domain-containing protein n=1 Tax=Allacma fusca TaxID=39272 RepID=A0A8J2KBD3_9HEXA|nr:unnamed protein product [Allacma fusca]